MEHEFLSPQGYNAKTIHMIKSTRQLFLIFLYVVLSPLSTIAQESFDLILDTQAKVDAFEPPAEFPPGGGLIISGADITNLDRLANTTQLPHLYIQNNPNLTSIAGLSNLSTVGTLIINDNRLLVSIDALSGIAITGNITIERNAKLTHIPPLNNTTTVGSINIHDNPELSSAGLGSIETIYDLRVSGNPKLSSLSNFDSLKSLRFLLIHNTAITTIDGFSSLTEIVQFSLDSNPNLVDLRGFATVQRLGVVNISNNAKLQSIGGFPMFNEMIAPPGAGSSRVIRVDRNPMLTSMEAFSNIQTLDNLIIENNAALKNVDGFRGLQRLPGRLYFNVINNPSLENLDGFSNLDEVGTGDSDHARIAIVDNPALTKPCGIFPFINALNNLHPGAFDSPITFRTGNNGFTIEQLKACGPVQPPYTTPLVRLNLDEAVGIAPVNSGIATATFTRSANIPTSSANGPSQDASAKSFDFGTTPGNYFVESTTPISQLRNLSDFTITGWVNAKSATTGGGGNRIVSWINNGGDGVDLVFESNGRLRLGVDGWPDNSAAFSSSGKITINPSGSSDNWVFFAVTYSSGSGNVQYYFGSNSEYLSRDMAVSSLSAGAVGNNIGKLAIGAFNDATRNAGTYDRMFRGAIDDIRIFGTALNYDNIWAVQFENRDRVAPTKPSLTVSTKTATSVTLQWVTPSDNVGIDRYVIIAKDLGDQSTLIDNIGQVNTYNFSDLRAGSTQRIYLQAWDQSQNASPMDSIDVILQNLPSTDGSLVHVDFNDMGSIYQNLGSASATFTRSSTTPFSTINTPVLVGGANAIDYGVSAANYYVTSSTPVDALKNLNAFTITGWVNARSSVTGGGGNRIISWINNGGDGVDLVYRNNGSLQLGVDQWPDTSPAFSSANKVPANGAAPNSNWIFFAVSYQSNGQVQFYFGSNAVDASLDVARTYSGRGMTGSNIGNLAVGAFNESTRNPSTYDRMFKGLIDDVRIYNSVLSPASIVTVQRGTQTADVTPPNAPTNAHNSAKTQTTATLSWTAATDNVGVTGYQIFNGSSLVEEVGVVTSYTVIGLSPSTTYQFTVKAKDARGNISAPSNIVTVTMDPPSQLPLVLLRFNEQNSTVPSSTPLQEGSAPAAFVRNGTAFSTNAPTAIGAGASYDFGTVAANKYVESTAPINELKNMSEFTLTGWVNSKSNVVGSGGNRIISWINNGGDGVDLVYNANGSLQLGIDQWPDGSPAISSANKVTTDASASSSNWVFFAATYKSTGQVQFYFGTNTTEAALDVTRTYSGRGLTGSNIGKFAVGAFNDATRNASTYDRMFKGLIDHIQVYGKALTESEIRIAQHGTSASSARHKDMSVARETLMEEASDEPSELFQNFPNPFNEETTITMYIRHDVKAAWISVYDVSGRSFKEIEVKERGKTRVQIQRGDLNPGMYFYSLRIDGSIKATKRMALTQ
jgi:chitodextrinase